MDDVLKLSADPSLDVQRTEGKVPLKTKIAWGFGGMADNYIMNVPTLLAMPIYNIGLHMNPAMLGTAMFIPGVIDAFLNPVMGNVTDNTRSRWGRRRPYVVVGAVAPALMLPILWMPPFHGDAGMFGYIVLTFLVYYLFYTVYVVPYTALGYELTSDYNERTRVLAWRMYIGLLASMSTPWIYKLCLLPFFGDSITGARWISLGVGALIVGTGLLPAIYCRERIESQSQPQIKLRDAMIYTFQNKPFMIMLGIYMIIVCGFLSSSALQMYVNIYYVCGGDKAFAATLVGACGTVLAVTSYASLPLFTWISTRWGKRHAMIASLTTSLAAVVLMYFTLTPALPYLQLLAAFLMGISLQGCWLLVSSMVADICDEDELNTGLRREGVYSAVTALFLKLGIALTALLGGLLLSLSGYVADVAEKTGSVPPDVLFRIRLFYFGVQGVAFAIAAILFSFYPITRARAEETRRILDERHRLKSKEYNIATNSQ